MKKPQWITLAVGAVLVAAIYAFGRITPRHPAIASNAPISGEPAAVASVTIDTFLAIARKQLTPEQSIRINMLEHSISRGDVKDQQIKVYHQLAHFWGDSVNVFEPYAWYQAEAARLENSEKSLTFAARLFLENLQMDDVDVRKRWKALQAKDLFERSLIINPNNDSAKVGLGACFLFGDISANPMEGIMHIREVVAKDSTNAYAQLMLAKGSLVSGQFDKAVTRLETVNRLDPSNIEVLIMLGDVYERMGDKNNAITWYERSLPHINREDIKTEVRKRIEELRK